MIVVNTSFRRAPWADVLYAMDLAWWQHYLAEARRVFTGLMMAPFSHLQGVQHARSPRRANSGAGAIALAAHLGARRIILVGYDGQHTGGAAHWHPAHPEGLGNAGVAEKWPAQFRALLPELRGIEVVNCSAETAIEAFPRRDLAAELADDRKPPLFVQGMHGMGDNLHQRAVMRELMKSHEVWLETPWPSIYHDMPGLHLVSKGSKLRTQAKNAAREANLYDARPVPPAAPALQVSYPPAMVRQHRGVLAAMSATCGVPVGDFRMPVPADWAHGLNLPTDRPVLAFRPLIERQEWSGCRNRNPVMETYLALLEAVRKDFFVVSVADLVLGKEWLAQPDIRADLTLHAGQLNFRQLCALWRDAALVLSSPGFGVVLAQAVGTPVAAVFGGYEGGYSFDAGARLTPTLAMQPVTPCDCFSHTHNCQKRIDLPKAIGNLKDFVHANCAQPAERQAVAA